MREKSEYFGRFANLGADIRNRGAREFGRKAWGDAAYAQEEMVAELASAFICADLDLTPEPVKITQPTSPHGSLC
jgi:antirestriction protein ArdC